jgi:hypothetical protein
MGWPDRGAARCSPAEFCSGGTLVSERPQGWWTPARGRAAQVRWLILLLSPSAFSACVAWTGPFFCAVTTGLAGGCWTGESRGTWTWEVWLPLVSGGRRSTKFSRIWGRLCILCGRECFLFLILSFTFGGCYLFLTDSWGNSRFGLSALLITELTTPANLCMQNGIREMGEDL